MIKKIVIYFLFIFLGNSLYSQDLSVTITSKPAYCRISSFQNGHGLLTATATGGTAAYSFLWVNLQNGETTNNTIWIVDPGSYQLTVIDAVGSIVIDTVQVDSINPVADFDVISSRLSPIPAGYIGIEYAHVQFVNTSTGFSDPNYPLSDTTFKWNYGEDPDNQDDNWFFSFNYTEQLTNTYYEGVYEIGLIAKNWNGCTNTIFKTIGIFGPADLEDETKENNVFILTPNQAENQLKFEKIGFDSGLNMRIYNMSGQLILTNTLQNSSNIIEFNSKRGTYIYEVINMEDSEVVNKGKFIF